MNKGDSSVNENEGQYERGNMKGKPGPETDSDRRGEREKYLIGKRRGKWNPGSLGWV